jgi:hypothetical protein
LTPDWVARGIALAGLVMSVVSLAWNIYAWRRQGPALKVKAKCTGRGPAMTLAGTITNVGRFDAQLEKATFAWVIPPPGNSSTRLTCDVPDRLITGLTLPQSLPAEKGAEFKIVSLRDLDPGLEVALHDHRAAQLVFHTASGRKGSGSIKYAPS